MSVNNSLSEQVDGVVDLHDLYNRELARRKNFSQPSYSEERDNSEPRGGYRDWKTRNGLNSSETMVSSLGKALHNQAVGNQTDSSHFPRNNYDFSNGFPSPECQGKDQGRFNDKQNMNRPQHFRDLHSGNESYEVSHSRPNHSERHNFRGYVGEDCNNSGKDMFRDRFDDKCQCCSHQSAASVISPKNQMRNQTDVSNNTNNRQHYNSPQHEDYPFQNQFDKPELQNQNFNRSPCQGVNHFQAQNQGYLPCHNVSPPFHCCQNVSPAHESTRRKGKDKKTDISIKKLYRILWLQNEQLGLLERQVSKLIELNFAKNSDRLDPPAPKKRDEAVQSTKLETCDVSVMAEFPCFQCESRNNEDSSSDSDSETANRAPLDKSLTLNEVVIPVNGEAVSPPASMHIDIHEYQNSSSSETEESDTSENDSEPVGWTFYDNVVGQVNNILKTASKKKSKKKRGFRHEVNLAMEQLKSIGVGASEYDSNNPKRVTFERGLKEQQVNLRAQSELSMNCNALTARYLNAAGGKVQDISLCNVISSNTNVSMATTRYLERYQIVNNGVDSVPMKQSSRKNRSNRNKTVSNKFLDITAIKQQPKLLPKDV